MSEVILKSSENICCHILFQILNHLPYVKCIQYIYISKLHTQLNTHKEDPINNSLLILKYCTGKILIVNKVKLSYRKYVYYYSMLLTGDYGYCSSYKTFASSAFDPCSFLKVYFSYKCSLISCLC